MSSADPLRVAMLAPIAWRVPPRHYGPWERVVHLLTEGLVRLGVDVTLFATQDAQTSAHLVGTAPRPYEEDPSLDVKVWEGLHIAEAFEQADRFDLIHNHFDFLPLTYSRLVQTPVVTTIHGFSSERILPVYQKYNATAHYVAISDADRHASLDYVATVHHGIDFSEFTLQQEPGDHLLFFGRIHPDKGAKEAIEVARRAGRPLVMAGIIQDRAYFERDVEPHVDGEQVVYVGSVGPAERDKLLGDAYALLHLISFDEPFGLSVAEAMACGTPVVATRRGSMPELIEDGVTGALVRTPDDAVAALPKLATLDRAHIRRHAEARFSQPRMAEAYLDVYRRVLAGQRQAAGPGG